MKRTPIPEVIKDKFNCSVKTFFEDQKSAGKGLKDIAELLGYHSASIRRVGLENGVSFAESVNNEIELCAETAIFRSSHLNKMNVLSRNWCAR